MKKGTRIEFTATPLKGKRGTVLRYIAPAAGCGGWATVQMDDGTKVGGSTAWMKTL